tara:strand:+ start:6220 stop:6405 length:186 start_codon:yes stop_codon:yes gene_type:complete
MRQVNMRKFRANLKKELDNLPLGLTRDGKRIAWIVGSENADWVEKVIVALVEITQGEVHRD